MDFSWRTARIPLVALILNRSRRPSHVAGCASPRVTVVNDQVYNAISITLDICTRGDITTLRKQKYGNILLVCHKDADLVKFRHGKMETI